MVAVFGMRMIVYPARAEIDDMGRHDQYHRHRQEPKLVLVPDLFEQQENDACRKHQQRDQAVVMFAISVPHGPGPDGKRQEDHEVFKVQIINDIDSENG